MSKFSLHTPLLSFLAAFFLLTALSGNAFASTKTSHVSLAQKTVEHCLPDNVTVNPLALSSVSTGNASDCLQPGYVYEPLPPSTSATATWLNNNYPGTNFTTCEIDAWFPYGSYSTDTKTRYDFWAGSAWLAWPGHDINQNLAPAGWNVLASNLTVNSKNTLSVTVHDDGGSGNMAMAAVRFICNY